MTTTQLTKPNTAVSVKLDPSDKARLNSLAVARKRTSHYLMKEAIQEYIKREEVRQNFIRAGEESAKDIKETGLHITFDEFSNWVDAIQTNSKTPMPICHI